MPGCLLHGGTVVDGTGRRGFRADVRIAGDRIHAIGRLRPDPGETVVDCGHLVVAPGFIDSHSHADSGLADDPQAATQVRQGITTAVVGQDGGSRWPMESLWDEMARIRPNLNLASLVGHGTLRTLALGGDGRGNPDPAQLRRMRALAIEALRAGACGISSGLEYEPGLHSNENELVAVMETAAVFGVVHASHARDEEDDALAAFDELLSVARRTGSAVHVSHIKLGSKAVWGKAGDVLRKLDRLRKDGIPASADVYPWGYWQSTIKTLVPPERLGDRDAWLAGLDAVGGPGRVRIAVFTPDLSWQETTLDQLAKRLSRAPVDIALDMVRRTKGGAGRESVVVEAMLDTDIARFATSPWVAFSSDGGLRGAHPRGAGSFPRVLGRYVREKRLLPLEEAVRKMTSLPASVYGIRGRGQLVPGAFADIVCFDPATVVENSTIAAPLAPPRGVVGVWVNGVPVVRRGEVVDGRSGRGLRRL